MRPVPLRAQSARDAGNGSLFAQSDGKPSGLPPKNPSGGAATGGTLRTGSGEARVQSTVTPEIINMPKRDSPSRISGQSARIDPSHDVCWPCKPPPPSVSKMKLLYVTESVDSRHRARGSRAVRVRDGVNGRRMTAGGTAAQRYDGTRCRHRRDGNRDVWMAPRLRRIVQDGSFQQATSVPATCSARDAIACHATGVTRVLRYNAAIRRRKCSVPATILSSTASSAQKRSRTS